ATCGTALGEDHFDLLRRFADRIVLAFDADVAGIKAALRTDTLDTPVRLDLDLRVAAMPPGADPADLAQRGDLELLREAVERAVPFLQFWIDSELSSYDISEPESRARALRATAPRIAKVSDEIARTEYTRFVAERLGVDIDTVERAMGIEPRRRRTRHVTEPSQPGDGKQAKLERELLRAVIADGGAARAAGVSTGHFTDGLVQEAFSRLAASVDDARPGVPLEIPMGDDEAVSLLIELSMDSRPVESVPSVLAAIMRYDVEVRLVSLSARLGTLDPDSEEYSTVFGELVRLQQDKRDLDRS
ncbi:MAG: toprim domain-containing protein, partial [Acidimicrobiia bacterium]|nr:toprim domain-containing protein [Acidimicrobiia bacterium]